MALDLPDNEGGTKEPSGSITDGKREPPNALIFGVFLMLIVIGLVAWQWSWIGGVVRGPVTITEAELRQLDGQDSVPDTYLAFDASQTIDTGLGVKENVTWTAKYLLLRVQDRWVLAVVPFRHEGNRIVGFVHPLDAWDAKFSTNALEQIRGEFPDHQMTSFYFRASMDQQDQVWAFFAVVGLLLLGGGYCCVHGALALRKRVAAGGS